MSLLADQAAGESTSSIARRSTLYFMPSWNTSFVVSPPRLSGGMHNRLKRSAFSSMYSPVLVALFPTYAVLSSGSPSPPPVNFANLVGSPVGLVGSSSAGVFAGLPAGKSGVPSLFSDSRTRLDALLSTRSSRRAPAAASTETFLCDSTRPRGGSSKTVRLNRMFLSRPKRAPTLSSMPSVSILYVSLPPHLPGLEASTFNAAFFATVAFL